MVGTLSSIEKQVQELIEQCRQRRAASLGIGTRQSMYALRE